MDQDEAVLNTMLVGQLEEWQFSGGVVWGKIYGDRKNRFPDGSYIHTSLVLECSTRQMKEGSIIETRNSIYRLGKPAVEEKEDGKVLDQQATPGRRGL